MRRSPRCGRSCASQRIQSGSHRADYLQIHHCPYEVLSFEVLTEKSEAIAERQPQRP